MVTALVVLLALGSCASAARDANLFGTQRQEAPRLLLDTDLALVPYSAAPLFTGGYGMSGGYGSTFPYAGMVMGPMPAPAPAPAPGPEPLLGGANGADLPMPAPGLPQPAI